MELTIYTDGGSLNNPGEAAYAFVIYENGEPVYQIGERLGIATNNFAEYTGLIRALTYVKKNYSNQPIAKISCIADSELMVKQLNGLYKVKHPDIQPLHFEVKALMQDLNVPITFTHVLREKNKLADSLVKKALGR
jgi:ribonuclease HI